MLLALSSVQFIALYLCIYIHRVGYLPSGSDGKSMISTFILVIRLFGYIKVMDSAIMDDIMTVA